MAKPAGLIGGVMQQGYIVDDIESAVASWVKTVGAGPFYVMESHMTDYSYRGKKTPCSLRFVLGYWGNMQIELIQPMNEDVTLYTDALKNGEAGRLNHMAAFVTNIDAALKAENAGHRVIQRGCSGGGVSFVYLEDYLPSGHHLELIECPEGRVPAFDAMQAIASQWDGDRPIRSLDELRTDMEAMS